MANEQTFLLDLKASFAKYGAFWFKIPDMPHTGPTKFDVKKPFDAIARFNGRTHAIEAKFQKTYEAFGLRHLRPNQIKGLNDWQQQGGDAWVFLNIRRPTNHVTGERRCNNLIIFSWAEMKRRGKNTFKKAELIKRTQFSFQKGHYPVIEDFLENPWKHSRL